jgi:hypothetical protein
MALRKPRRFEIRIAVPTVIKAIESLNLLTT